MGVVGGGGRAASELRGGPARAPRPSGKRGRGAASDEVGVVVGVRQEAAVVGGDGEPRGRFCRVVVVVLRAPGASARSELWLLRRV